MKVLVILSVLTLCCTVSSLPGGLQLVQNNPVVLYTQPSRSIITPFQYQVPSAFPLPLGLRLVQQPVLTQATVLRNVPRSNGLIASTRFIPSTALASGPVFANLRSQNSFSARPVAVFRNEDQNDAVVIGSSDSDNNIPANVPIPVQDDGGQQTPSQSYGYGVPVVQAIRTTYGAPIPQAIRTTYGAPVPQAIRTSYGAPVPQAIRTSYGAPIPTAIRSTYGAPIPVQNVRNVNSNLLRNVNTIIRQQPQSAAYEIQRANFVGEFRTASQGPIFPVAVITRNVSQRNQNSGHQLSRQNASREPVRSASRQQPRSQGGYSGQSGVSPIPVRSVFTGNNRLQYYAVRRN